MDGWIIAILVVVLIITFIVLYQRGIELEKANNLNKKYQKDSDDFENAINRHKKEIDSLNNNIKSQKDKFETVKLGECVEYVGNRAFDGCDNLISVEMYSTTKYESDTFPNTAKITFLDKIGIKIKVGNRESIFNVGDSVKFYRELRPSVRGYLGSAYKGDITEINGNRVFVVMTNTKKAGNIREVMNIDYMLHEGDPNTYNFIMGNI